MRVIYPGGATFSSIRPKGDVALLLVLVSNPITNYNLGNSVFGIYFAGHKYIIIMPVIYYIFPTSLQIS